MVTNFKKEFKEIKIEVKRKSHASAIYAEKLPATHYTETEQEEIEALFMGTESQLREISKQ